MRPCRDSGELGKWLRGGRPPGQGHGASKAIYMPSTGSAGEMFDALEGDYQLKVLPSSTSLVSNGAGCQWKASIRFMTSLMPMVSA